MSYIIYNENCLEAMKRLEDNSVDSIVTDPPYGLSFMGKKWDYDVPSVEIWAECLRVLKPGGHLLAFAGTRTQHRMAVRIEDAGFEIRDMIAWVYGSGFPKSLDVSKAIDKQAGAERVVLGPKMRCDGKEAGLIKPMNGGTFSSNEDKTSAVVMETAPSTEAAKQWQGWGTALKPALEPITVARKPLVATVADNVLAHGTGALNIDGCRVSVSVSDDIHAKNPNTKGGFGHANAVVYGNSAGVPIYDPTKGRWPANLIHDGSDEVLAGFPSEGRSTKPSGTGGSFKASGAFPIESDPIKHSDNGGSAARFFYCAKASKRDRDEGLEGFEAKATAFGNQAQAELKRGNLAHDDGNSGMNKVKMRQNIHPTVKPTDLMRYLCRLVTPPGGVVLDPFTGSGSTGKAAMLEGFSFIGCELSEEYAAIANARIEAAMNKKDDSEPEKQMSLI